MKRRAIITGITGQDGSYLAELLLEKGYEVHGIVRRVALEDPTHRLLRIQHILSDIELHAATMESYPSIFRTVSKVKPDEVYHLAAQSYVAYSFEDEFSTLNTNINGTHHVLSAIKEGCPEARFYFAGSSEMFGKVRTVPQNEETHFHPRSAYGISKVAGFDLTRNYREAYSLHASSGIVYNHESPRRGYEFVTRKITHYLARIVEGLDTEVRLGNLEASRDWGHAADFVRGMWLMLQQDKPDDYVLATGVTHTVREFCDRAFRLVGLDYRDYVKIDKRFLRPSEVQTLHGDASKAKAVLGWEPEITFEELVKEMVERDIELIRSGNDPALAAGTHRPGS